MSNLDRIASDQRRDIHRISVRCSCSPQRLHGNERGRLTSAEDHQVHTSLPPLISHTTPSSFGNLHKRKRDSQLKSRLQMKTGDERDAPGIPHETEIPAPERTMIFLLDPMRETAWSHEVRSVRRARLRNLNSETRRAKQDEDNDKP